jgi:hypothetical protein
MATMPCTGAMDAGDLRRRGDGEIPALAAAWLTAPAAIWTYVERIETTRCYHFPGHARRALQQGSFPPAPVVAWMQERHLNA